jgi:hypothetical protein
MSILHILNVADWALIAAGVAVALLLMIIGSDADPSPARKAGRSREGRRRRDPR